MNRQQRRAAQRAGTPVMPTDRVLTAYHEAGHAVIHEQMGTRVQWVDLNWSDDEKPGAKTTTPSVDLRTLEGEELAAFALATVAGPLAELHYLTLLKCHGYALNLSQDDANAAWEDDRKALGAVRARVGEAEFDVVYKELQANVIAALLENWPKVEAIAVELLHRYPRRLEGDEVRWIIQKTTRGKTPSPRGAYQ